MPLVDAARVTVRCVYDGIEQGRKEVEEARRRQNEEFFTRTHCLDATEAVDHLPENF